MSDFDYYVRDGYRTQGSRGAVEDRQPARVIEIRYDPNPATEVRILDLIRQVIRAIAETPK